MSGAALAHPSVRRQASAMPGSIQNAVPLLWRLQRVHHSEEDDETSSNFDFNLPWWDRLFGTNHAQPRARHEAMRNGIRTFRAGSSC